MISKFLQFLKFIDCSCGDNYRPSVDSNVRNPSVSPNPRYLKKNQAAKSPATIEPIRFAKLECKECHSDSDYGDPDDFSQDYIPDCCFLCKEKEDLRNLQCSHKICYICINNELQITLEKEKITPLICCICNKLIQSKDFQFFVDEEN